MRERVFLAGPGREREARLWFGFVLFFVSRFIDQRLAEGRNALVYLSMPGRE